MKVHLGTTSVIITALTVAAASTSIFSVKPFWLALLVTLLIAAIGGTAVYFGGVSRTRGASRLAVDLAHRHLADIMDNVREGILMYDEQFTVLAFNRAAEQIFSIAASDIVGQNFSIKLKQRRSKQFKGLLAVFFPALAPRVFRRSPPGQYPQIIDISFDDPPLELQVATVPLRDERGAQVGFLKIVRDRTRELTLIKEKSDFITVTSHQLRTPLTGLSWALENLQQTQPAPEQQPLLTSAIAAVNRLFKITEDLLDVAKIEEGKFGYQFADTDLTRVIEDTLQNAKPVADSYGISLFFENTAGGDLPVRVDPTKLGLAITNLVDNAIKYNVRNGQVTVRVERAQNDPYLIVRVTDTGIGIPENAISNVFKKFFRADNAIRANVEGTGLGLFIARNVIRRHGGKIWVESVENRGSTFSFSLPTNPSLIPDQELIYNED